MSEFNHVSQFLETAFGLSFGLVLAVEILKVVKGLPYPMKEIREAEIAKEEKQEEQQKQRQAKPQTSAEPDMQPGPKMEPQTKPPNDPEADLDQRQKRALSLYRQVNLIFDQFMPVVMCCMVAGILVSGTYVLSAICFFCYLFFNLVFNYARLYDKLDGKNDSPLVRILLELSASIFIIIYFIGLFIRVEFMDTAIAL